MNSPTTNGRESNPCCHPCAPDAIDAINAERLQGIDAVPVSSHQWDETDSEGYRRLEAAFAAHRTVVFDAPRFTRTQRDDLRCIAYEHEVATQVLYVAISSRICRERWLANCVSQARFDVRDADFTNVETLFEPPTDDGRPVIYD